MVTMQAATITVAADNSYAALFLAYVNDGLDEALATIHPIEGRLPEEERGEHGIPSTVG